MTANDEVERLERMLRDERRAFEERERALLLALVSFYDGFLRLEKATAGETITEDARRVQDRFLLIRRRLEHLLEREGVERIAALGTPFDPDLHEVFEVVPPGDAASGIVIDVEEDPFTWRGALLRRGKVVTTR